MQAPDGGTFGINANGTVTPIDLQGNVLASLPDGTKDELTINSAGAVTLTKRVGAFDASSITTYGKHGSISNWFFKDNAISDCDYAKGNAEASGMSNRFTAQPYSNVGNLTDGQFAFGVVTGVGTKRLVFKCDLASTAEEFNTWIASNQTTLYYPLTTPQTIDLGYIDISHLQDIPTEIPISFVSTLTPDSNYLYENNPSYEVKNPYEDYNAPTYAYPPNHMGQDWETFDANDWNKTDMLDYTGQPESHAVYTVELCELMQSGVFNWKRPELDWSEAAYDTEQYERFCKYFESRFMFREISMLPPLQWFTALKRMLVYELMPKYKPLYAQVENGISPLGENEYYKERHVSSSYPETLLSGNSDYISSGEDREFERIKVDNAAEALEAYRNRFRSVDAALGDELEVLFISMYTSFVNAF